MNPLAVARQGKGALSAAKRAGTIVRRYGLTSSRMERSLRGYMRLLGVHDAKATFPFTASALERSRAVVSGISAPQVEFAVHGYWHVDHKSLPAEEQKSQIARAAELFAASGIAPSGFRSPYLRWNDHTIAAIEAAGFDYDSSQAIAWDVIPGRATERYLRVLDFYGAEPAATTPCVPSREGDLVRIPYCLPDDEAIVERLTFRDAAERDETWVRILQETHRRGELFTLGLHPERFGILERALDVTLTMARQLGSAVWIARLDEIAGWWKERSDSLITIEQTAPSEYEVEVDGPEGVSVLTRSIPGFEAQPWLSGYRRSSDAKVVVRAPVRPFVGLSNRTSPAVGTFLRQQGYIVESAIVGDDYSIFIDCPNFGSSDKLALLDHIEHRTSPLVRLGRWPGAARSALSVTGDIDAMTLWDYVSRFKRG